MLQYLYIVIVMLPLFLNPPYSIYVLTYFVRSVLRILSFTIVDCSEWNSIFKILVSVHDL